ncbi:dnaJ homolog subfamily C member 16 [Ixodes scapularis]|uniref:DnaJ homolog subfamily C member 16 n=1 Tax=Ixodes scapularis TaxID=6945 RepID=A0A4D5RJA8_IXOSC|nr:dnaJ homolog subfamily C member 16 [Ixodes scapularis]
MLLFYAVSLLISCVNVLCALVNPYETLGVPRSADAAEIKRAYKRLVREWHPDKNKDPAASEKFIEVTKAYELLTDPERKESFDRYGQTEDTPNFRRQPDYSQFNRFEFDPFESMFAKGNMKFQFKFAQGSVFHKATITLKAYENRVVPDSNYKPYFVLFYGDLCFPCLHVEPIWQRIVQEMEPLGVGFATIHAQHEAPLAQRIGVGGLPYLVALVEGRPIHYRQDQLSLVNAVDFCRQLFPRDTVTIVDDVAALDDFLSGWSDNRVRAVVFSPSASVRLRYLLAAFQFRERVRFGYVRLGRPESESLRRRYAGVGPRQESLLVFNEHTAGPVALLSMAELDPQALRDVLSANRFLILPRLSSQLLFDELCPPEALRSRRRLCVVLVTANTAKHDPHRAQLRDYVQQKGFPTERVRFTFVYKEKQAEFVNTLSSGEESPKDPMLHLVIIWRRNQNMVQYQWIDSPWEDDLHRLNETKQELENALSRLLQSSDALPHDARLGVLADEHARGLLGRLLRRLVLMGDVLRDHLTRYEVLPALSVALSFGFIVLVGYFMSYLVQMEEKSIQERYRREGRVPPSAAKPKPECKLTIHELRGETYNGLVRLLKPGCRTVVLLVDQESKPKLLPQFFRAVFPYRKNKTLMFSMLLLEKNLEWYRKILSQTLSERRTLNINPKNCIGTVLSLNGHRKYFCVYHAKHLEPAVLKKKKETGGDFIGFEDSSSGSEASDVESGRLLGRQEEVDSDVYGSILFEEHLLDGLPNWLDRLFEGTTKRYYIQYWPECMK